MFRQIDKQLCHAFDVNRCRKTKHRKVSKSPAVQTNVPSEQRKPDTAVLPSKTGEAKERVAPDKVPASSASAEKKVNVPAKEKLPETPVPLPRLRPENLGVTQKITPPVVPKITPPTVPLPKPETKAVESVVPKPAPPPTVPDSPMIAPPVSPPAPHLMPDGTLIGEACYAELQRLGAKFDRLATPVVSGACSVSDPVKLTGVVQEGNSLKFPDAPTFTCGFAVRFVDWVTEQAEPIVQSGSNAKIATIGTGPGYQCRGRNGDITAKLSEHAFGNAVDIERLKLADGRTIEVMNAIDTASPDQPVLAALRAAGCKYFMTVLGPGANSAHASHFHFDLERRGKKGDNRLCE